MDSWSLSGPMGSADGVRGWLTPRCFSIPPQTKIHLRLRVLASVVVSTEERKNADDQAHHHEQRQSHQEEAAAQGDLGTNATDEEQDLLHPPVRTTMAH